MNDPKWLAEDINSLSAELSHRDDQGLTCAGVHDSLRRAHAYIAELREAAGRAVECGGRGLDCGDCAPPRTPCCRNDMTPLIALRDLLDCDELPETLLLYPGRVIARGSPLTPPETK